jgi:hypothetical protein
MRITFAVVMLLAGALAASAQERLSDQLRNGVVQEEVNRDLGKAIAAYQAVVAQYDEDRKAAVSALFRLAECSRKAGMREQAVQAYLRVVREFPEQSELVESSVRQLKDAYGIAEPRVSGEGQMADLQRRLEEAQLQLRQFQSTREPLRERERSDRSLEALQEELRRSSRPLGAASADASALERGTDLSALERELEEARARLEKRANSEAGYLDLKRELDDLRRKAEQLRAEIKR